MVACWVVVVGAAVVVVGAAMVVVGAAVVVVGAAVVVVGAAVVVVGAAVVVVIGVELYDEAVVAVTIACLLPVFSMLNFILSALQTANANSSTPRLRRTILISVAAKKLEIKMPQFLRQLRKNCLMSRCFCCTLIAIFLCHCEKSVDRVNS